MAEKGRILAEGAGIVAKIAEKQFGKKAEQVVAKDVVKDATGDAGRDLSKNTSGGLTEQRGARGVARDASRVTRPDEVPHDAAPFRQDIAGRVPPYGAHGPKTSGILDLHDSGGVQPLQHSGYGPPSELLPRPRRGMNGNNVSHVEAHAAAQMHLTGTKEATLYINRIPCPGRNGCDRLLPRMLPPGAKLTIYGPDGYVRVVYGVE